MDDWSRRNGRPRMGNQMATKIRPENPANDPMPGMHSED
jgi:hypothetical protein